MSSNQARGYISLLYSVAEKPLALWSKHVSLDGKVHRMRDDALHGDKVIEILGPLDSVAPTSITAPAKVVDTLNIKLAVLVLVIKNLESRFKLEVQVTDKKEYRRRFSFLTYNFEKLPSVNASVARIPLKLEQCWNILEINLQTLCRAAYGTDYEALQRMIIYPNCRLRRVYLQDRHYDHDETPVELCKAFFDTYTAKWGISSIEKTCQTEESHIGLSKECDSNLLANNGSATIPPTKADLSKNVNDTNKLENSNTLGTIANSCNPKTLKKNFISLSTLMQNYNEAKMYNNQSVMKRRNRGRLKSLVNESIVRNKLKETSNDITEEKQINKEKTHETGNSFVKFKNRMSYPASSVGTSQLLKMQVDKTLVQKNKPEFPRRLYPYGVRDLEDTSITQRSDVNSIANTKFGISVTNVPLASKPKLSGNIGFSYQMNYMTAGNDKHAKRNEKTNNGLSSLIIVEENVEDNSTPHSIEKEAKPDNARPTSTCLKKNKTGYDARDIVNGRFFEKLQNTGLIKTQIERYFEEINAANKNL